MSDVHNMPQTQEPSSTSTAPHIPTQVHLTLPTSTHPATTAANTLTTPCPSTALVLPAPLDELPGLVLPILLLSNPPLLVASTLGSTVAVFLVFVNMLVENVVLGAAFPSLCASASSERNTRA
ncbi:hypothetical protein LshimejAT787_1700910 [Lyophyllum shimeji]|uniref:Uncharacterized protein n=1 Tax=Lyophyllum shimeji TaxID=47721 RepID=A0A9P3PZH5_LYOSH|nr:hypothetical protein LshimejAT787_1700910 [Lyophyllum shimeji]